MNGGSCSPFPKAWPNGPDSSPPWWSPLRGARAPSKPEDLLQAGGPLYLQTRTGLFDLVLMDTPDFDTGARGQYANRPSAQGALEAADLLIYIFTNSNYNNRDNTDFIARMLTGIGRRKCFLVYRCYPSFTDTEVTEHAMTVARNIYGGPAERYVLGIFRADEDNGSPPASGSSPCDRCRRAGDPSPRP